MIEFLIIGVPPGGPGGVLMWASLVTAIIAGISSSQQESSNNYTSPRLSTLPG